jgi:protein TonB
VRRLLGEVYLLTSTVGWEGVGMLEGPTYRGVFRHSGASDVPRGAMGEHTIDWSTPERPTVQATYTSLREGSFAQRWWRIPDAENRAVAKPVPRGEVVAGKRPAFGDYTYVEQLPEAVTKVPPNYPEGARKAGIEGTVQVQALVIEDGTVADCRIVQSIPGLDQAAVAAVHQWRFKPAMAKGVPVSVWVVVPVRFSLR